MHIGRTPSWLAVWVASLLAFTGLHAASLSSYPPPTCDESSYGSNGDSVLEYGNFGQSMIAPGDPYGRDVNSIHLGRLYSVALAGLFSLVGANLIAARIFSLAGWVIATGLTYQVGRRLFDRPVGIAAGLLFAALPKTFYVAHIVRPEIWTAAATMLTLWLLLEWLRQPAGPLRAALLGLICVAPLEVHANGLWFLLADVIIVLGAVGLARRRWALTFFFFLGVGLGLALWAALHLWPDPELAIRQLTSSYDVVSKVPWRQSPAALLEGAVRWFDEAFWHYAWPLGAFESVLFIFGLVIALRRRTWADRILVAWLLISLAAFLLLLNHRPVFYASLWLPGLCLLAVAGLRDIGHNIAARWPTGLPANWIWGGAVTGLIGISLLADGWLAYRYHNPAYATEGRELASLTEPDTTVMGDSIWWWALRPEHKYFDDGLFYVDYYASRKGDTADVSEAELVQSIANTIRRVRPTYVLADDVVSCFVSDPISPVLTVYLDTHCQLVGRVAGAWVNQPDKRSLQYGQWTTVYRCD